MSRADKYAKQARNAARVGVVQNHFIARRQKQMLLDSLNSEARINAQYTEAWYALRREDELLAMAPPPQVPPGWYQDPYDSKCVTWWDGSFWHPETKRWA